VAKKQNSKELEVTPLTSYEIASVIKQYTDLIDACQAYRNYANVIQPITALVGRVADELNQDLIAMLSEQVKTR
jgi:hypothetical protein